MINFGTVQHAGKTLNLTQNAFLDCDGSNTGERYYSAGAIDADGNEYKVRWDIRDGFDGEDEGDASDCGGRLMKTLKLFTADGRALTDLVSSDESILLPTAITEYDCESVAHHADSGDLRYDTLDDLCEAYGLDVDAVQVAFDAEEC